MLTVCEKKLEEVYFIAQELCIEDSKYKKEMKKYIRSEL